MEGKVAIFNIQGKEKCLAWELGVVCEFVLSSRGDCLAKPYSMSFFLLSIWQAPPVRSAKCWDMLRWLVL